MVTVVERRDWFQSLAPEIGRKPHKAKPRWHSNLPWSSRRNLQRWNDSSVPLTGRNTMPGLIGFDFVASDKKCATRPGPGSVETVVFCLSTQGAGMARFRTIRTFRTSAGVSDADRVRNSRTFRTLRTKPGVHFPTANPLTPRLFAPKDREIGIPGAASGGAHLY